MLIDDISHILPNNEQFQLLFITSEPKECNPLIKYRTHYSNFTKPNLSIKLKYFFLLIDVKTNLLLFGIEIYKYISINDVNSIHYLFISKIDTTGLIDVKLNINRLVSIILKFIIDSSLHHHTIKYKIKHNEPISTIKKINKLVNNAKIYNTITLPSQIKFKLSLFTKSSNQYFFPESSKNKYKHLIDGDLLLKWWIKTLDSLEVLPTKKILIPGSLDNGSKYLISNWELGSIYDAPNNEQIIYNLPNFPDDPKTRFLEFLIIENRYKLNLLNFYQELGFRQEFRLGNVVGIIGCELNFINMDNANHDFKQDITPIELTNKQYKKLIKLIKSEDFSIADDIKLLVTLKLPFFLKLYNKTFEKNMILGKFIYENKSSTNQLKVNNLNGLVKRKKKN